MATVRDCMSSQLVYLRDGDRALIALRPILDFGITAVPVLDDDQRPVGVVALRDLVDRKGADDRATGPAVMVSVDASVEQAARALAEADLHHLVVVDRDGRAVGMISAVDLVRALIGMKAKHPRAIDSFPARP